MRLRFLLYALIGLAAVAGVVAWVFHVQRGAHMRLEGSILKVRTLATDANSSVALIDFRVTNQADYTWMVRSVDVSVIDGQGYLVEGSTIADPDAARLFDYFPLLGQKFNDSLTMRSRILPHQTVDRMIGVRFEIPEAQVLARKNLKIRISEVDRGESEIEENPAR
ncbi:MAG: hypothetical protein IT159_10485 [Bryobacterales bacterium]|nr:hypothetical protein [Bryobacterales bacterium]